MIAFDIGYSGQVLSFSGAVIGRFERYRQTRWYHREAGGQLFARISQGMIALEVATGPRWRDRRTRHTYEPHRPSEQKEIDRHHALGVHFVGDWHTHAETRPRPSRIDLDSVADSFKRSKHSLNAFIMVIVGTDPPPSGMLVLACDASNAFVLNTTKLPLTAEEASFRCG